MKRTPEFVCGLIGSILAAVFQVLLLFGTTAIQSNPEIYWELGVSFTTADINRLFMMYGVGFVAAIVAIVAACLVHKKTKSSGILMIIMAVILELINMLNIISFVLLMIAGVMCLARNPKQQKIIIETATIDLTSVDHNKENDL